MKHKKDGNLRWALTMTGWTVALSISLSALSSQITANLGLLIAFLLLLAFILLGIVFDIIGLAVATASEKPFHSMASRRVPGSKESLWLLRRAARVSNFCNDMVGDISGIVSGTTGAVIVLRLSENFSLNSFLTQLALTGLISGMTVGGKALGKSFAMNHNVMIVHLIGRLIRLRSKLSGKNKNNGAA